jgi:hypothetical protein
MVKHCINDKFKLFLDKTYYLPGTCSATTRHSFYCNFLDTPLLIEHYLRFNHPKEFKVSSGNVFNHHNLISNDDHYEKYKRRCDRLINLIENNEKIVLLYYNCYTMDYDDIVDFYNSFSHNKNIYVLAIFENQHDKKILYENTNCKIYQNYDRAFIFDEVKREFENDV